MFSKKLTKNWEEIIFPADFAGKDVYIENLGSKTQYCEIYVSPTKPTISDIGFHIFGECSFTISKDAVKVFARNINEESFLVASTQISNGGSSGGGVNPTEFGLVKKNVDEMKPLFDPHIGNGHIFEFSSGNTHNEGRLYRDNGRLYYCNKGNTDNAIDVETDHWLDFSLLNGFDLLQKRNNYMFHMSKVKPTDGWVTIEEFLPIANASSITGGLSLNNLDGMVFRVMYMGETTFFDAHGLQIMFIDLHGFPIGNAVKLMQIDFDNGGYFTPVIGKVVTGEVFTFFKQIGKNQFYLISRSTMAQ